MSVLSFVLPGFDRTRLVYWNTKQARESYIDTEKLFNESDMEPEDDEKENSQDSVAGPYKTKLTLHKLLVEDEFLLTLMKLRMALSNTDLGERFNISEGTVTNIFLTWINYLYRT